ncbi:hypothetical protein MAR_019991, partial [Mya arenaria]
LRVFPFHVRNPFRREKEEIEPVQYSHDPPGHTCGLPCCNKDLQVRLLKQKQARSCIGIQENDALSQNFTFKGRLRRQVPLEHGFITVQEQKQEERPKIPDFEDDSEKMATLKLPNEKPQSDKTNYHFLKGRAMTLPQGSEPNATEKLYLEDFNFGESGDFLDADGTSNDSEIEYYIT